MKPYLTRTPLYKGVWTPTFNCWCFTHCWQSLGIVGYEAAWKNMSRVWKSYASAMWPGVNLLTKYKDSNGIELPITRTFFDFPRRFESTVVSNVPRGWASGFVAVAGGGEGDVGDRSRRSHRKIGNCKPSTLHVVIMGCTFYTCRFLIKVFPGINLPFSLKSLHKHM